jgi:DNA-binding transcriptional regulator YiaG
MKAKGRSDSRTASRPARRTTTAKGREIVASMREILEVERAGVPIESRFTVHTVELPDEPVVYNAIMVRATRDRLMVSQAIFAHLMGVSATLVRAWEQGQRNPAPWARRLLDEMNRNPRHWRRMLRRAS